MKQQYFISDYSLMAVIMATAAGLITLIIAAIPQLMIVAALYAVHLALISAKEESVITELADIVIGFALLISMGLILAGVL